MIRPHTKQTPSPTTFTAHGCLPHHVVEVAIHAQDVGVAQVGLDLDLTPQLVLHVGLSQLALEQDLEGGRASCAATVRARDCVDFHGLLSSA